MFCPAISREKFLGAVHWVGAVIRDAEGSYLSYKMSYERCLGRYNGSKMALL